MYQNNLSISPMSEIELEQMNVILETEFDDFWNYSVFKSELENPNSTYFVIRENQEIVGFIGVLIVLDEADITNIVIKKSHRGNRYFKIITRTHH